MIKDEYLNGSSIFPRAQRSPQFPKYILERRGEQSSPWFVAQDFKFSSHSSVERGPGLQHLNAADTFALYTFALSCL